MWRWIVLALVAANGAFWLWSHGELRPLGLGPIEVSEPARLKNQIHPEALRVTPQEPALAPAPSPSPSPAPAPAPASTTAPAPAATPAAPEAASATTPAQIPATAAAPIPAPAATPAKGK